MYLQFLQKGFIYIFSCIKFPYMNKHQNSHRSCLFPVLFNRISITFRKMDESKRPVWFTPEPDLQGIEPLPLELNRSGSSARSSGLNRHNGTNRRGHGRRGGGNSYESRGYYNAERSSEHNDSGDWPSSQRRGKPRSS